MAGLISLMLHGGVAVIVAVFFVGKTIAAGPPAEVEVTFYSAPPPPPPPPPPAASTKKKKKKKKVEKKPEIKPEELVQPQEIPEDLPEQEETEVEEEDFGVEGGVEGGVAGGTVGGEIGGVIGGEIGGTGSGIGEFGIGESKGRALSTPRLSYPDEAKMMEIEGTVQLRILVDITGKIVKAKDAQCTGWHTADKTTRRKRWHPVKCIEAVAGPEVLYYEAIMGWSGIKFKPWKSGDVFTRYWVNVANEFKLQ